MPARLAMCSHFLLSICNFLVISRFGFKSGIWLLIAQVSDHCFSITSFKPIMFESYAALFSCTEVIQASDLM